MGTFSGRRYALRRTGVAGPMAGGLRRSSGAAAMVALALLTFGCGGAGTASPQAPASVGPSSSSSSPASASASPGADAWDAAGDSFGVDRASWPTTVAAAKPMIERLPKTLAGQPGESYDSPATEEDGGSGASAGVQYGGDIGVVVQEAYITTDTEDGEPAPMTAQDLMAASFLLGYGCADGSYRGTALPAEGGIGPAPNEKQSDSPVWFSCRIDGAEGDEDYTGQVVGWTSGETAWQVLGPDADTVRSLVTALRNGPS